MPKRAPQEIFARRISGQPGLAERLLDVVGTIPQPREAKSAQPDARARSIARRAAATAASTAGALALPPGPLGWLTIAPELYAVWKLQAQMVADIAGTYGKRDLLTREQMLYCLFSHTAAGAFRDLVIRVGERYVVRRAPLSALYAIANKVAIRIAQRSAGRMVTRWVPALGALGVAGYVYYDTGKVADTTMELFLHDVRIEGELEVEGAQVLADAAGANGSASDSGAAAARAPGTRKGGVRKAAAGKNASGKVASGRKVPEKTAAGKKQVGKKAPARKAAARKATGPAAPSTGKAAPVGDARGPAGRARKGRG